MVVRAHKITGTGKYYTRHLDGEERYARYLSEEDRGVLGDAATKPEPETGELGAPHAPRNHLESIASSSA